MIWLALLLAQIAPDPALAARGERIFAQNCSVGYCHGAAGTAGQGPRLRGRGFDRSYVLRVTRDGIPKSAMPAWKTRLHDEDIAVAVEYIMSLGQSPGTTPAQSTEVMTAPVPPQAERGRALFFDATRGTRCGTCHALGGHGIAVGPDLAGIAKRTPQQIAAALRRERSTSLVTVRTRDGDRFPARLLAEEDARVRLYDLSEPLPVLRTLERGEIVSSNEGAQWTHEPFLAGLDTAQLAEIIVYIRWVALNQ